MIQKALLSTAYLAPIQYYTILLRYNEVLIEIFENFTKQTYRNRCRIYGANGELSISIPVKKLATKTKIKDILIDYDTNWQKLHWKSIESAYRSSPFFEFYEDDLRIFYEKKYKFLIDFNIEIQNMILEQLDLQINLKFTPEYQSGLVSNYEDFRNEIHPKKINKDFNSELIKYTQVFSEKYGFLPNLSIIDLLFNEGPNAIEVLKRINL
ncbi:WbqC family protein [Bacteroidota bacterium]